MGDFVEIYQRVVSRAPVPGVLGRTRGWEVLVDLLRGVGAEGVCCSCQAASG